MNLRNLFRTDADPAVLLVRIAVGFTFIVAGTGKLRDIESTTGFFGGLGFPAAAQLAPLVGVAELVCGILVLIGLATRLAVLPLIVIMVMAIVSTKLSTLVAGPFGPFAAPRGGNTGVQAFLSASRLDFSMLMANLFLLMVGAGRLSADAAIAGTARD